MAAALLVIRVQEVRVALRSFSAPVAAMALVRLRHQAEPPAEVLQEGSKAEVRADGFRKANWEVPIRHTIAVEAAAARALML